VSLPEGLTGRPIAHRGLWRPGSRPENSLAAFEAACAGGYGVELDARLTADGEAVVFHDDSLERLTAESGLVEERTLDELQVITLLGGDHQTIPSLAQALEVIAGRSLVLVELKTPPCQEGLLEARVAELLEAYDGPCAVLSFNAAALGWMARRHPEIPRGLNLDSPPGSDKLTLTVPHFLSIDQNIMGCFEINSWRSEGKPVIAWTVRSPEEQARLAGRVDNIMFEGFTP
jgi:glycerophosphoryl diester phosphodiesterase